jgi:hypothetical protein
VQHFLEALAGALQVSGEAAQFNAGRELAKETPMDFQKAKQALLVLLSLVSAFVRLSPRVRLAVDTLLAILTKWDLVWELIKEDPRLLNRSNTGEADYTDEMLKYATEAVLVARGEQSAA